MPRFVILEHDYPTLHWDLLLESGPILRAWRLLAEPATGHAVAAEGSVDHRLLYLDFEGEVSGNRGHVHAWDRGHFEISDECATRLVLELAGWRCQGRAVLDMAADATWLFHLDGRG